jgi:hypothetical protein
MVVIFKLMEECSSFYRWRSIPASTDGRVFKLLLMPLLIEKTFQAEKDVFKF